MDKSQISFTELCIELLLLTRLDSVNIVLWQQNVKFSFHQQTVEFGPTHIFTQIYAPASHAALIPERDSTRATANYYY